MVRKYKSSLFRCMYNNGVQAPCKRFPEQEEKWEEIINMREQAVKMLEHLQCDENSGHDMLH